MAGLAVACLFACGLATEVRADEPSREQLIASLSETTGRARIDLLNEISKAYWAVSTEQALDYARQAEGEARRLGDAGGEAAALRNVGVAYWYADDYDAALEATLQAMRIFERLGDEKGIAACKSTTGTIYLNLGRFDEALEVYREALAIAERTGDESRQGVVLQNMGTVFIGQERFDDALAMLRRALALTEKSGSTLDVMTTLANIAGVERRRGNYAEAIAINRRVVELATESGSTTRLADAWSDIGESEGALGNRAVALDYLQRALEIAEKEDLKRNQVGIEESLVRLYESWGDDREALVHQKRLAEINRAILDEESAKAVADLEVRYQTEKKEQQIEIQRLALARERAVRKALAGTSILLVLLATAIYGALRAKRQAAALSEQLSRTDALTGLANRRALNEALERERQRWPRERRPFSVVLADVDHFKRFNDTYGHDVGDRVLVEVARAAKEAVREVDLVARWGGEEILVLAPGADEAEAFAVAQRLQEQIRATEIAHPSGPLRVTATLGVATWRGDDGGGIEASADTVIKRADEALYRGKAAGRDRIVSAEPIGSSGAD